jgi:hypothetical protein
MKTKCPKCDQEFVLVKTPLARKTFSMGTVIVHGIERLECQCGERQFSAAELRKLQTILDQKEREIISRLPVKYFVTAPLAYELLGVTRQAFSKRMKQSARKFPYSYLQIVGSKEVRQFFKPSLEKFKETGDGRIDLRKYLDQDVTIDIDNREWLSQIQSQIYAQIKQAKAISNAVARRNTTQSITKEVTLLRINNLVDDQCSTLVDPFSVHVETKDIWNGWSGRC